MFNLGGGCLFVFKLRKLHLRATSPCFILNSSKNCDSLGRDVEQIHDGLTRPKISSFEALKQRGSGSVFTGIPFSQIHSVHWGTQGGNRL